MNAEHGEHNHSHHMASDHPMTGWEKFKMSMTMTMGMDHSGLAGREMAQLMEEDIRRKFFFALAFTLPILAYSPLGAKILGLELYSPIPIPWLLLSGKEEY